MGEAGGWGPAVRATLASGCAGASTPALRLSVALTNAGVASGSGPALAALI